MDASRILATANSDIALAKQYYEHHVEPDLMRRYELYRSDRDRYKKLYPKTAEMCGFRSFDLWSAVEWLQPSILKAFFGSDRIISISGVSGEDADQAEKIMKLLQWQLTVKNQGYRIFKNWFSDSLVTNLGILKCYWKRETETRRNRGVFDQAGLVGLIQKGAKILASEPDFMSGTATVEYEEEVVTTNQPVVEVVRPGDIRFTPDGRTLKECSMVAHRKRVTIDHLRREAKRGIYDAEAVEEVAAAADGDFTPTRLEQELSDAEDNEYRQEYAEKGRMQVEVYECYMKTDINDDGLLEDAIVTVCEKRLLRAVENPYGRVPLFELVPFWDTYQVWSKVGLAEIIEDTQDLRTGLLKQVSIALGLANQPRCLVNTGAVMDINEFEDGVQYVRCNGDPREAIFPIPTNGLSAMNMQMLEYLSSLLEQWTPTTRYNQGTDASSLNKTATGINMIMTASQQRQEEIVRNFAETGISELFRFLIKLNQMYLDQPQIVRLQNDIIQFAPDDLEGDYDLSVDASSGVGARDSKVQVLTTYMREMWPAAMQVGAAGVDQFVMAGQKLLKLMGVEDAEKYLHMPDPVQQMLIQMMAQGGMAHGGGQQAGTPASQGGGGGQGADGAGGAGAVQRGPG